MHEEIGDTFVNEILNGDDGKKTPQRKDYAKQ